LGLDPKDVFSGRAWFRGNVLLGTRLARPGVCQTLSVREHHPASRQTTWSEGSTVPSAGFFPTGVLGGVYCAVIRNLYASLGASAGWLDALVSFRSTRFSRHTPYGCGVRGWP
jgi:hypothetical protein